MFIVYCSYVLQCYSLIMFFLGMFADFVTCNLCQENFYSLDELNRHRSEKHKYKQIIEGKTYQIPNNYVWQYSFAFFNVLLHNIPFYLPPYLICAICNVIHGYDFDLRIATFTVLCSIINISLCFRRKHPVWKTNGQDIRIPGKASANAERWKEVFHLTIFLVISWIMFIWNATSNTSSGFSYHSHSLFPLSRRF